MTREETIQSLVRLDQPLPLLRETLAAFPWDWEGKPLATVHGTEVASILRRYMAGDLTAEQVESWANLVEVRDDIEFDAEAADAIFCLANPVINGPITTVAPNAVGAALTDRQKQKGRRDLSRRPSRFGAEKA